MTDFPKWPHLENLDRVIKDIPDYLRRPDTTYTVTEKVHGTNARFGMSVDGVPWVGSRNLTVAEGWDWLAQAREMQGFVEWVHDKFMGPRGENVFRIPAGATVFGEWAGRGIQKGIDYGDKAFHMFGLAKSDMAGGLVSVDEAWAFAAEHGIPFVPILKHGPAMSLSELDMHRKAKSRLAPQNREGVVIYPWPPISDEYGHAVIAKYKAPDFSERAHAKRDLPQPADLETVQAFVDEYVTEVRFEHVLQQVQEVLPGYDVTDPLDVRYTGDVMRFMVEDIKREGGADYEALSDNDKKMLGKVANKATKALLDAARQRQMEDAA